MPVVRHRLILTNLFKNKLYLMILFIDAVHRSGLLLPVGLFGKSEPLEQCNIRMSREIVPLSSLTHSALII